MKAWFFGIAFALVFLAGNAFAATGSISVSLNSLNTIAVGESATVTATVTASGDSASNAQVTISLPSGLTTSDSTTQSIGTINNGASSTKSWSVFGNSEGTYTITVTASATSVTSQTANATLVVSNSALIQATTVTAPASSLAAGGTTSFAVQYSNNGGAGATVSYALSKGSGLTLSSGSLTDSFDLNAGGSTTRNWTFSMAGNGDQTITLATTATSNAVPAISYTIIGPTTGSNPGTNPATTTTTPATTTGTPSTTPATTSETPSSETQKPESKTEIIMPKTEASMKGLIPTAVQQALESAGITDVSASEIIILSQSLPVTRSLEVKKITDTNTGNVSYSSTISVSVKNSGNAAALNVRVVEEIPKTIASNASEIKSLLAFTVLKADPVLQFSVSRINAGESATVEYTVQKQLDLNAVSGMTPSMVVARTLEETPAQPATGATTGKEKGTLPKAPPVFPIEIVYAAIAVIIIIGAYLYFKKR